jgi:CelD/BcsL family acetyltransferase involved in cellulose biosynthesis
MSCSFSLESFDRLASLWAGLPDNMKCGGVFALPGWHKAWWQAFGSDYSLFLGMVRKDDAIIGIAPLKLRGKKASFICEGRVCDYLDFIISPGWETDFYVNLLDELIERGVIQLELAALRPDSTVLTSLVGIAGGRGYQVSCRQYDASLELELPDTWGRYLSRLASKQRHEVRRKMRRLEEMGTVNFHVYRDGKEALSRLDLFIQMFRHSRQDKARFMTDRMRNFFELLARAMADDGLLRLGFLELNSLPVASVAYFDYNNRIYLYNSGYDPSYRELSVGLISKVLCIKDSIEQKKDRFDFLRGTEVYKYRLGGTEIPLQKCHISIGDTDHRHHSVS